MSQVTIRKAAVLGAGVMGAQIAAHFANAQVEVLLYDLPSKEGDKNAIANKALANMKKMNPAPYGSSKTIEGITAANYEDDLEKLESCDFIIEAIAEKMEWKKDLYNKINPHLKKGVIFTTNTSGLSITELAGTLADDIKPQFCGIHFFNPPRYLPLVEVIPHAKTDAKLLDDLETFVTETLGKSVVRAKDTPNFIGNRLGVFAMSTVMKYAEKFDIPFEIADQLTGKLLGRPNSATFRTADLVGLDTMLHVTNNTYNTAKDDPWLCFYEAPKWLQALIDKGALGNKTKCGIYKKVGKDITVIDTKTGEYRPSTGKADKEVVDILKEKDAAKRFQALKASDNLQAQFVYSIFRDSFHYAAYHLPEIADTARDCDLAIRWGFGWKEGLFETWQKAGWDTVAHWIKEDNANGKTIVSVDLPSWVEKVKGAYDADGKAYNARENKYEGRRQLPVYERQAYPDPVLNEKFNEGETVLENDSVRLWTTGDNILIVTVKTKMCTIGAEVLQTLGEAVKIAEEQNFDGIVIYQRGSSNFSVGANLEEFGMAFMLDGADAVKETINNFQTAMLGLRYAMVPVVAAVQGFAFGGGCEMMLHCDRTVAALESYVGLVEVGVGLVPAGGGCKEMALRAQSSIDPEKTLQKYYKNIAMGEVAKSAQMAREMGYLRDQDIILMNPHETLYVAKQQVKALAAANYRPPFKPKMKTIGRDGKATIQMLLANMRAGYFISDYDYKIGSAVAEIMVGGNVDKGNVVPEDWYLKLERDAFVSLAENEKTQGRIQHMLTTGKPLRN
ncbi:3-hydroxyacyl-CoA dehydrogenase/enoyl-CoA hydratase family protein [Francisellaceae bacterium]|nr:3-hydroxyacyl-CoA dehydrogenase/enoyl-CoA hydratase family protein [Francisellaceae bacterium]